MFIPWEYLLAMANFWSGEASVFLSSSEEEEGFTCLFEEGEEYVGEQVVAKKPISLMNKTTVCTKKERLI